MNPLQFFSQAKLTMTSYLVLSEIENKLTALSDPYTGQSLMGIKSIQSIDLLENGKVREHLELSDPAFSQHSRFKGRVKEALLTVQGNKAVEVGVTAKITVHKVQHGMTRLKEIKKHYRDCKWQKGSWEVDSTRKFSFQLNFLKIVIQNT